MLKCNLSILMIACGLLGAHVNLAAANQAVFPGNDAASGISPIKVSYVEERMAGASGSLMYEETNDAQGSTESPFPVDNSRD